MQLLVTISASKQTVASMWTAAAARDFVDGAVELSGLTRLGDLCLHEDPERIVALQMIAESHIAVHLYLAAGRGYVDVFSCRDFDLPTMVGLVASSFCAKGDALYPDVHDRGRLP
jgi:S-adenosylmethionine/arginine decarboxylase-like enzyme